MVEDDILLTVDFVGLYVHIPYEGGLLTRREVLDVREDKIISTGSLIKFTECVSKNNVFDHNTSFYKQFIGTNMDPPHAMDFLCDLKEQLLNNSDKKSLVWWRYMYDIFMVKKPISLALRKRT